MRIVLSTLAVCAALALIAVSGAMNYLFMESYSKSQVEGFVLGGASIAVDVMKSILPVFIWWAWCDKRYAFLLPASAMFLLFSAFSFTSAIGFAATNRGHVSEIREGANATLKSIRADIATEAEKLAALPKHRPPGTVEQAVKAKRQNRRWTSTKGCADGEVTAAASRRYCQEYFTLKAELETAITAQRIETRLATLQRSERRLTERGAGGDADPQVSLLAKLSGNEESSVRTALIIFIAALLEIGSGLGLWIATGHSEIFRRRQPKDEPAPQPAYAAMTPQAVHAAAENVTAIAHAIPANDQSDEQIAAIEDYVLDRIRPSEQGGLTMAELYDDYSRWVLSARKPKATQALFGTVIEKIMMEVGIANQNRRYVGIRLDQTAISA